MQTVWTFFEACYIDIYKDLKRLERTRYSYSDSSLAVFSDFLAYLIVFQVVEFTREDGSDIFLTVKTVWTFFEAFNIHICKDL